MNDSIKTFPSLPNWIFEIDEVSNGVFRVKGKDPSKRSVEAMGDDLEKVLKQCEKFAIELDKKHLGIER